MQKTVTSGKHKITVKLEKRRYYVQHSDINQNRFLLVDDMLNLKLTEEEKSLILKTMDEL